MTSAEVPSATARRRPWSSAGREPEAAGQPVQVERATSGSGLVRERPRSTLGRAVPRPTRRRSSGPGRDGDQHVDLRARRRDRRRPSVFRRSSHLGRRCRLLRSVWSSTRRRCSAIQRNVFGPATGADDRAGWAPGPASGRPRTGRTTRNSPAYDASSCGPEGAHRLHVLAQHRAALARPARGGPRVRRCSSRSRHRPSPGLRRGDRESRSSWPSVIGSDSTGRATAVESRIARVTAAAVASDTHGSRVRW